MGERRLALAIIASAASNQEENAPYAADFSYTPGS